MSHRLPRQAPQGAPRPPTWSRGLLAGVAGTALLLLAEEPADGGLDALLPGGLVQRVLAAAAAAGVAPRPVLGARGAGDRKGSVTSAQHSTPLHAQPTHPAFSTLLQALWQHLQRRVHKCEEHELPGTLPGGWHASPWEATAPSHRGSRRCFLQTPAPPPLGSPQHLPEQALPGGKRSGGAGRGRGRRTEVCAALPDTTWHRTETHPGSSGTGSTSSGAAGARTVRGSWRPRRAQSPADKRACRERAVCWHRPHPKQKVLQGRWAASEGTKSSKFSLFLSEQTWAQTATCPRPDFHTALQAPTGVPRTSFTQTPLDSLIFL